MEIVYSSILSLFIKRVVPLINYTKRRVNIFFKESYRILSPFLLKDHEWKNKRRIPLVKNFRRS